MSSPDDLVPCLGTQRGDDLLRPAPDSRAVGSDPRDVGTSRHLADLGIGHPRADDAPRHVHATHPLVIEDLISTGDDRIDRGIFGPRHVPEEPHERVEAGGRAQPHLVIVELEDTLDQRRAAAHVARVHGGVLAKEKGQKVHAGGIVECAPRDCQ
jgi:hypothetical protein